MSDPWKAQAEKSAKEHADRIAKRKATLEKSQEFLDKVAALFKEHGATLDGCGCCGSPCLTIGDVQITRFEIDADGKWKTDV